MWTNCSVLNHRTPELLGSVQDLSEPGLYRSDSGGDGNTFPLPDVLMLLRGHTKLPCEVRPSTALSFFTAWLCVSQREGMSLIWDSAPAVRAALLK